MKSMKHRLFKRILSGICLTALLCSLIAGCNLSDLIPESEEEKLYKQLFDPNNKIELNIRMSKEQLLKMQGDYDKYKDSSPIYRMADLDVTITLPEAEPVTYTIEQVGVRMKGTSYSSAAFYSETQGIYNLVHLKLNFQQTFDKVEYYGNDALVWANQADRDARKARTFATLEKLDMKWNRNDDCTYIRESYCVDTFREHGIVAPRTTLASVDWADYHTGVYTLYEPIDEVFINRNLPKAAQGGNLYKCAYQTRFNGKDSIGVENEIAGEFYQFDLKTNKKTPDHTLLNNLISVLNDGIPTKEELETVLDMDNFLTFCAVSYFVGNTDDMRNDTNNVYIYFRADNNKAIIIPHDYDRGLGVGKDVTQENPFGTTMLWLVEDQENPLFLYTVCQGGLYVREFAAKLNEIKTSRMLTNEVFNQRYETAKNLYAKHTTPSKIFNNASKKSFTFNIGKTNSLGNADISFALYVPAKLATWEYYNARVEEYVDYPYQIPTGFFLVNELNNWQQNDANEFGILKEGFSSYYLNVRSDMAFKVYRESIGSSYGYSWVDETSKALCKQDGSGNIVLSRGNYVIHVENATGRISIEKRGE